MQCKQEAALVYGIFFSLFSSRETLENERGSHDLMQLLTMESSINWNNMYVVGFASLNSLRIKIKQKKTEKTEKAFNFYSLW